MNIHSSTAEKPKQNLAIYIHWPFCLSKCPYCDFNSHVASQVDQKRFLACYLQEISYYSSRLSVEQQQITSIFFGGGTPSLMQPDIVASILNHISKIWNFSSDIEITLEANPTSIEKDKFSAFKNAGVNRISIGVQSFNDQSLKFLGREHGASEAKLAIEMAANIFDRYSFDLIYALPEQKLNLWIKELEEAIVFSRKHMSLYQLTIEKGTRFFSDYSNDKFSIPDDDLAADMYQATCEIMESYNMPPYEISNYAREGDESRHNLNYWQYGQYLGIGAGAHSRVCLDGSQQRSAIMNIHSPEKWLDSIKKKGSSAQNSKIIDDKNEILTELLLSALRLTKGIKRNDFRRIMGADFEEIFVSDKLLMLQNEGLLSVNEDSMHLSKQGVLLCNNVITQLI